MKLTWTFCIAILFATKIQAQESRPLSVMFYNVENLFDTINDPLTKDDDFTPTGKYEWNSEKYNHKLKNLAKVIQFSQIEKQYPTVIGLCEIENAKVVADLIEYTDIKTAGYNIAHIESPDARGIDVGLMYRSPFKFVKQEALSVEFPKDDSTKTRDILYVKGLILKDTVHIFVNHWPSRRGGQANSEIKRITAARVLRSKVDQLQKIDANANIIIMGDFNDYPNNPSVYNALFATNQRCESSNAELFNLGFDQGVIAGGGSHSYKGEWGLLDQIIVSRSILRPSNNIHASPKDFVILKTDFLLFHDVKRDEKKPDRTFVGSKWTKGYSDHLPVRVRLHVK